MFRPWRRDSQDLVRILMCPFKWAGRHAVAASGASPSEGMWLKVNKTATSAMGAVASSHAPVKKLSASAATRHGSCFASTSAASHCEKAFDGR